MKSITIHIEIHIKNKKNIFFKKNACNFTFVELLSTYIRHKELNMKKILPILILLVIIIASCSMPTPEPDQQTYEPTSNESPILPNSRLVGFSELEIIYTFTLNDGGIYYTITNTSSNSYHLDSSISIDETLFTQSNSIKNDQVSDKYKLCDTNKTSIIDVYLSLNITSHTKF